MTPETAAALAGKAAQLSILYVIVGLFVIVGAFAFLAMLGEKTLGLDLRGFIDNVEKEARKGNLWPGVIVFIVVPSAILGLVIDLGLR